MRRAVPAFAPVNTALQSHEDMRRAIREVRRLRLPKHPDPPKNWDSLSALHEILTRLPTSASILDAGSERYSCLLPWLEKYGYEALVGNNLVFDPSTPLKIGSIVYEYGDLTATRYADRSFDAVTCLSVIEHGVDLQRYFAEMARILKPGGLLVTSTDYFDEVTDTRGQQAYGAPIKVFSRAEIEQAFEIAAAHGFELTSGVDLSCRERAVTWREFDLSYTFIVFSMVKTR